ncbi:MAG: response regulator transcription factor [Chloroflexi bacterium]|nr:response regulator transcription factor [Chloroflexota bacterium]
MTKILIADDHPVIRQGLKQILAETSDIVVSGEASSGPEALKKVENENFDVVLLDLSMPEISGLDILKQIKAEKPHLPVLILTIHPEEQYAIRALKAGASGYVEKKTAPDELVKAIRKVYRGGKYVSSALAEKLAFHIVDGSEKALHLALSDREFQVLRMIATGKTVKEISEELFLSVKTISTYRSRILNKMKMKSNADIIRYAIEMDIV